ncbi:uncharacterized protein LOC110754733 isoform X2 [Prunus avium]|uniref:Uncharacterized protein LOC110754733 isoform X2 n=1 Tax=Prunus avium TaxID=42229 RepID=A0A6P5SDA3_PRUAV|nr:uncharacterized protein LOC110754733 isoform X2 [Prunus avium]
MENPVEKRIREEYGKLESNPSHDFMFRKLDWDSYEWQGALRGPSGTEFAGGIYHVRLLFAKEYPWEKPSFIFLTENGSFNIKTKTNARLNWKPTRKVEQAFLELIELMPECPDFKSDSEEHKDKRRDLAKISSEAAPIFGTGARQKLIDVNHQYMQSRCKEEVVVDRVGPTQMESDRRVIVEDTYNIKNSGEKRILEEYDDIKSNPSSDFTCLKLNWNPYEWQFAIRGHRGTEFDGGIYHGMVKFSEGYPSNPPSIVFLTENGCFDVQTIISLSIRQCVREALVEFIEKMATYSNGGRLHLAIESRVKAPTYGTFARQEVMDEIHQHMLRIAAPVSVPELIPPPSQTPNGTGGGSVVYNIYNIYNIGFSVVYNIVRENIINASNSKCVGVMDSMNGAPDVTNPMITKILCVVFIVAFWGWSYKFLT